MKFIFQIPKNQSIFDVGCGNGVFLYLIAIFRKPRKLFGVDVIDTDLDTVKKIFPNTNYIKYFFVDHHREVCFKTG